MTPGKTSQRFPDRKISEAFLHFSEPLLEVHGSQATVAEMEQSLKLAFTIWNAVVYEDATADTRWIDMVRNQMAGDAESAALVECLIDRKRSLFGHDHRLVGEFKLRREGGEWRLRAEARDPTSTNRGAG